MDVPTILERPSGIFVSVGDLRVQSQGCTAVRSIRWMSARMPWA